MPDNAERPPNERYRITRVTARDFKSLDWLEISPGHECLILLHGPNRSGKTSALDALTAALAGKRSQPEHPIRDGQPSATIEVELSDAARQVILTAKRSITQRGQTLDLTRTDHSGAVNVSKPQTTLSALLPAIMFRPLAFSEAPPADQTAMLADATGRSAELHAAIEERRKARRAKAELQQRLDMLADQTKGQPTTPADSAKLAEAKQRLSDAAAATDQRNALQTAINQADADRTEAQRETRHAQALISEAEQQIESLKLKIDQQRNALTQLAARDQRAEQAIHQHKQQLATLPPPIQASEMQQLQATIQAAGADAARAEAAAAAQARIAETRRQLADAERAYDAARSAATGIIANAEPLPDGLAIDDDDKPTYNGRPLGNLSGSERDLVAVKIAAAANPKMADVLLDEVGRLDDDSLAALVRYAQQHELRLWATDTDARDGLDADCHRVAMPQAGQAPPLDAPAPPPPQTNDQDGDQQPNAAEWDL